MNELKLKALAKINIGLDVIRRREDGYHEVSMIMQTIHLFDRVLIRKTKEEGIFLETNLSYLPNNENNLGYRAAKLLIEETGLKEGVRIRIEKHIPVAAGLAGGSTDAAAVLYGMNRIFKLGFTGTELMERGGKLGADVPYCLMRGTALAEGIGEKLTSLPPMPKCPVLIAKPGISVSTKWVYQNLNLTETVSHPDIERLVGDIKRKDLPALAGNMGNILETVTIPEYPVIEEIKNLMRENGALNAMMSGSGPTVFGLFENRETAKQAYFAMKKSRLARQVFLTEIYNNRRE